MNEYKRVDNFYNKNILVIGDVMVDTYIYGGVSRISPEAPVPVICPDNETNCLGGAANVARNAASLGANVDVIFLAGNDKNGEVLKEELKNYGISTKYLIQDDTQHTINKIRVVGNNQQIARIDYFDKCNLTSEIEKKVISIFNECVKNVDIIIISDYAKGMCSENVCKHIISTCSHLGKPVIVDPKGSDWEKYCGATIVTPNLKEINQYSGLNVKNSNIQVEKYYTNINKKVGIKYVLLTRSECGMTLLGNNNILHISTDTQEVYDVSGAGDTVVAAIAYFLQTDLSNINETIYMANLAAGIVVSKPGTAVVTQDEIQNRLMIKNNSKATKCYSIEEYDMFLNQLRLWKTAGNTIVTTNGCFDILHSGHIKLLNEAKQFGDKLIVLINSDSSVKRLKGDSRPINKENDRAYVLSALKAVDAVVVFEPQKTPYRLKEKEMKTLSEKALKAVSEAPMYVLDLIRPNTHVKGGDYLVEDLPEALFAENIELINFKEGYSTTSTIKRMKE